LTLSDQDGRQRSDEILTVQAHAVKLHACLASAAVRRLAVSCVTTAVPHLAEFSHHNPAHKVARFVVIPANHTALQGDTPAGDVPPGFRVETPIKKRGVSIALKVVAAKVPVLAPPGGR
jgi:hypothetical protein